MTAPAQGCPCWYSAALECSLNSWFNCKVNTKDLAELILNNSGTRFHNQTAFATPTEFTFLTKPEFSNNSVNSAELCINPFSIAGEKGNGGTPGCGVALARISESTSAAAAPVCAGSSGTSAAAFAFQQGADSEHWNWCQTGLGTGLAAPGEPGPAQPCPHTPRDSTTPL